MAGNTVVTTTSVQVYRGSLGRRCWIRQLSDSQFSLLFFSSMATGYGDSDSLHGACRLNRAARDMERGRTICFVVRAFVVEISVAERASAGRARR